MLGISVIGHHLLMTQTPRNVTRWGKVEGKPGPTVRPVAPGNVSTGTPIQCGARIIERFRKSGFQFDREAARGDRFAVVIPKHPERLQTVESTI